jgi:hypothetical protein
MKDLKAEIAKFEFQTSQMSNYKDLSNKSIRNNNELITRDSLIDLSKINFDDLVDLETEKLQKSHYDVDQIAKYHWRKVKEWRIGISRAGRSNDYTPNISQEDDAMIIEEIENLKVKYKIKRRADSAVHNPMGEKNHFIRRNRKIVCNNILDEKRLSKHSVSFNLLQEPEGSEYINSRTCAMLKLKRIQPRVYESHANYNDFNGLIKSHSKIPKNLIKAFQLWNKWGIGYDYNMC